MRFYLILHQHKLKPFQDARANHYVCNKVMMKIEKVTSRKRPIYILLIPINERSQVIQTSKQSNKKAHVGKINGSPNIYQMNAKT